MAIKYPPRKRSVQSGKVMPAKSVKMQQSTRTLATKKGDKGNAKS
jgi:hypothetical protein